MTEHTQEPWRIGKGAGIVVADEAIPEVPGADAVDYYGGHLIAESIAPRNARRIVACVNACASLTTETLELAASGQAPSLKEIFDEHVDLHRQRDALVAMLAEMVRVFDHDPISDYCRERIVAARAALAKIKE